MDMIKEFLNNQIKPWWDPLDKGTRVIYVSVSIALLAAIIISTIFFLRPRFETLYVGLDMEEAGQVVEKLKEYKVAYQLENGGTTINVARKDIYDVRLKLASEGLPRTGSMGYEILDKSNLGMTDFLQKINYRRAMEGEIAKSIASIKGVKSARVHIVIPEQRLFKEDKKEATASVVLALGGAGGISSGQVEGIIYLVSSSVEGLNPDNVTILDSGGRLLSSKKQGTELGALSASQMELQRHVESYLEEKALSMLDPVVGPGKSVVKISANLNFEQVEKTIENYDPDNTTVRSEEKVADESLEENTNADGRGKTTSNKSENVVTNYEVNRTVQHVVSQVGNLDRLWVSIVVDGATEITQGPDGPVEKYVPRSQEELDQIATMVKGAIGFDSDREDILEITNVPFQRENFEYSDGFFTMERFDVLIEIAYKLFIFLIMATIFFKARKRYKEYMTRKRIEARRRAAEMEAERKRQELLPKIRNEPKLVDHMKEIANQNPLEIARVVKTMIAED